MANNIIGCLSGRMGLLLDETECLKCWGCWYGGGIWDSNIGWSLGWVRGEDVGLMRRVRKW